MQNITQTDLAAGLAAKFAGVAPVNITETGDVIPVEKTTPTTETTPVVEAKPTEGDPNTQNQNANKDSSLNAEENEGAETTTEVKPETVPTPTFEESLTERSGGKFKTWEEVQALIDKPEVVLDERAQKLNDFVRDFPDKDFAVELFFEHQRNDYDKMDVEEVIAMQEAINNPTLNDEEITALVISKYRMNTWAQEGEEISQDQKGMEAQMKADAEKARKFLKDERQKVLIQSKAPDPKIEAEKQQKADAEWRTNMDKGLKGLEKISLDVFDQEGKPLEKVDYALSKEDQTFVKEFAYNTGKDLFKAIEPFVMEDGKISAKKIIEMGYKLKNFDSLMKKVSTQAHALGAKSIVASQKNASMAVDSSGNTAETKTREQVISEGIASGMKKAGLV